ncbi:hypothetical protein [Heyndrickxia coagulans]|uniref:Uncharacterized protein n=1 Tax=Heyndrickxia coagulans TaxID=1398 RepID=A0AAW7CFA3_HEYCO|nr:hypothetical protein [Heyndrickxia coagulans]MDL5039504.1 hypothetical protein [Heyndrickxia coagulans]
MDSIELLLRKINTYRAELQRDRVARGLPPDPPAPFLPIPFSAVLAEQLAPVAPVLAKYAQLVQQAGEVLPIDTGKLQPYAEMAELLRKSKGTLLRAYGLVIGIAIHSVKKAARGEVSANSLPRRLYHCLRFTKDFRATNDFYNVLEPDKVAEKRMREEYRRLKSDSILFKAELKKYRDYYDSIKNL